VERPQYERCALYARERDIREREDESDGGHDDSPHQVLRVMLRIAGLAAIPKRVGGGEDIGERRRTRVPDETVRGREPT
jgi:hypothetical protein